MTREVRNPVMTRTECTKENANVIISNREETERVRLNVFADVG
jgi:hypothetical protein